MSVGLTGAVRGEAVKLRTTRLWWGLLLGTLALIALNAIPTAVFAGQELGPGAPTIPSLDDVDGVLAVYGSGYQAGYLMVAVLGTVLAASDYRHRTVTQTFLATPRRGAVVAAKLLVAGVAGMLYGVAAQLATLAIAAPVLLLRDAQLYLGEPDVVRTLVLGVLGIAVWGVIGAAVGALLRNQVAAVLLVVGLVFVIDLLVTLILEGAGLDALVPYTPNNASTAVVEGFTGFDLLPWWGGLLVLLSYGALAAVLASVVSVRRDVT